MTITDHLKIAAEKTGVPAEDIIGPSRRADIYRARVFVWRELRKIGFRVVEIAQATNRNHSAVCHALGRSGSKDIARTRLDRLERAVAQLEGQVAQLTRIQDQFMTEKIEN